MLLKCRSLKLIIAKMDEVHYPLYLIELMTGHSMSVCQEIFFSLVIPDYQPPELFSYESKHGKLKR